MLIHPKYDLDYVIAYIAFRFNHISKKAVAEKKKMMAHGTEDQHGAGNRWGHLDSDYIEHQTAMGRTVADPNAAESSAESAAGGDVTATTTWAQGELRDDEERRDD